MLQDSIVYCLLYCEPFELYVLNFEFFSFKPDGMCAYQWVGVTRRICQHGAKA